MCGGGEGRGGEGYRGHVGQRSDAHGSAQVVGENEKCGTAAAEQAVVVDAIGDAAHAVLSDTEPYVSTGWVGGAKVTARGDVVEGAAVQVSTSTHAVGQRRRHGLQHVLPCFASRNFGVCRKRGNLGE